MFNINIISLIVPILLAVAFLTTVEWNSLGHIQLCNGPNIISSYGLLQPIADAINVFTNEPLRFLTSSILIFVIAPVLALSLALTIWIPLPIPYPLMNINLGILFILAISILSVYSILWSGWASNSNYALIGALWAVAQFPTKSH